MTISPQLYRSVRLFVAGVFHLTFSTVAMAQSFVNFESGHVRPLALSPQNNLLFAANTPDNRVEIFSVSEAGLTHVGNVVVGLEPVALAARSDELWVVNHLSDSVSVVDTAEPTQAFVKATLQVGDEPRDIVFAGSSHEKAFVTTAHRGQSRPGDPELTTEGVGRADVWVFRIDDLDTAPHILTLFTDTPRGLAASPDGTRVYAAGFHSGNRSSVLADLAVVGDSFNIAGLLNIGFDDGYSAPGMPPLPPGLHNESGEEPPDTSIIVQFDGEKWIDDAGRDWSPRMRLDLPDKDVFAIDATQDPPIEVGVATDVGTILFNVAVHPTNGKVYVSNMESKNLTRFEPVINGHIAENRVTVIDFESDGEPDVQPVHLNPHIDYSSPFGDADEIAQSLAFPLGMEFSNDGQTLYTVAFGSRMLAILDEKTNVSERVEVGGGPSGVALDEGRNRIYVLNRFDQTIAIVDTNLRSVLDTVELGYDAETPEIREGRPLLYDARNSGHGDSACASCHIFADFDSLGWDLGDPGGRVEDNPVPRVGVQGNDALSDFHPMKGVMTTQSLRGMMGAGAMHWRGDRIDADDPFNEEKAFMTFRPAFRGLLGMETALPVSEMAKFRDFILTVEYPPSPIANIDGTMTTEQRLGKQIFDSNGNRLGAGGDGDACADCHTLPLGTNGRGSFEILTQDFKVAHLRNLYQKVGMFGSPVPLQTNNFLELPKTPTEHVGDQVRGFGFLHDGAVPTLFDFFRFPLAQFTFLSEPGRTGDQKVRQLESFLLAFDTGLPPVVGQQVTLDANNISSLRGRFSVLRDRALAGDCDLVAHGTFEGLLRGFVFEGSDFQSDREVQSLSENNLLAAIRMDAAVLTFSAVPVGSGTRIGVDRDEDTWFDRDELDASSNPADPESIPQGSIFRRGEADDSGKVDFNDAILGLEYLFLGDFIPTCFDAMDSDDNGDVDFTDSIHSLTFLFLGGISIPPPGHLVCGMDPTIDVLDPPVNGELGCESYLSCD